MGATSIERIARWVAESQAPSSPRNGEIRLSAGSDVRYIKVTLPGPRAADHVVMGIYDREYYRDEDAPRGFDARGKWSMVTNLIVLNVGVHLLNMFVGGSENALTTEWMAASADSLREPWKCWQLLTYGFAHSPHGLSHIFWNMLALFIFGRRVEETYGPREFLRFYLVATVLGGLVFATRHVFAPAEGGGSVVGASGAVTAVTLLYCMRWPNSTILLMMVLPVPAWFVGATMVFGDLMGVMNPQGYTAFDVHLVGAAVAIVYFKLQLNFGGMMPNFAMPKQMFKRKPKLRVHTPPDDVHEESYDGLDEEGDRVLAKLNATGIDSLTAREKKTLEDYSRRMKQKHR